MTKNIQLSIKGMSCSGCANRLSKQLNEHPQIQQVEVSFANNSAQISYLDLTTQQLIDYIEQLGFSVVTNKYQFKIGGMSCTGCANRLAKNLPNDGVISAEVNFAINTAQVLALIDYPVENIIQDIKKLGFTAELIVDEQNSQHKQPSTINYELTKVLVALSLSLPLMLPMLGVMIPVTVQFVLASLVQFGFGLKFYKNAYLAIKSRAGNMDLLVAVGTSSAYGLSLYLWIVSGFNQHQHLYFEASSMVISLVLIGKYLESKIKAQTGNALANLQKLRPATAIILRDNQEQTVSISNLQIDDVMIVKAGTSFAADGLIIEGSSFVDESLISGESKQISKQAGDLVHAGAINGDGRLLVKITALGADTQLGKIMQLVKDAQSQKAPIEKMVDRISYYFVPTVILISLLTLVGWLLADIGFERAIINAVTVLVIACPCALGLATPAAVAVGVGLAARNGILLHKPEVLEHSQQIDTVIFDKTGTLTLGNPKLMQIVDYDFDVDKALIYAASLQSSSSHPLGKALLAALKDKNLQLAVVNDAQNIGGLGVIGQIDGISLALGNHRLLHDLGFTEQEDNSAFTSSYLLQTHPRKQLLAKFEFNDELRTSSLDAIEQLQKQNIDVAILSGDKLSAVKQIAAKLKISNFKAEVLPHEKYDFVVELQKQGRVVAMIGDGINDAPALAAANIGIAMGKGTDVAVSSADITLLNNDPLHVVAALAISRKTYLKIYQNLFWAFIYNLFGIPLAALGILNPIIAGLMMALSSISVISNSLLLNQFKFKS